VHLTVKVVWVQFLFMLKVFRYRSNWNDTYVQLVIRSLWNTLFCYWCRYLSDIVVVNLRKRSTRNIRLF